MDIDTHGGEGSDSAMSAAGEATGALDFTTQRGNADGADWQEDVYQKIKSMKELHFSELDDLYWKIANKVKEYDSLPQCPQNERIEKLKMFKTMLEHVLVFLRLNKHDIQLTDKEKLIKGQLPESSIQLQQPQFHNGQTNPPMQPVNGSLSVKSTIYNSQQHRILSPATGFSQQNPVNRPQEVNISSLSSQSGMSPVLENLCSL